MKLLLSERSLVVLMYLCLCHSGMGGNWFGSSWVCGAYYPGSLDREYTGIISGPNIAGVVKFTLRDGMPAAGAPSGVEGLSTFVVVSEGLAHKGEASADVNHDTATVTGYLISQRRASTEGASENASGSENALAAAGLDQSRPTIESAAVTDTMTAGPITGMQGGNIALPSDQELSGSFTVKIRNSQLPDFKGYGRLDLTVDGGFKVLCGATTTETRKTVDFCVTGSVTELQNQFGSCTSPW